MPCVHGRIGVARPKLPLQFMPSTACLKLDARRPSASPKLRVWGGRRPFSKRSMQHGRGNHTSAKTETSRICLSVRCSSNRNQQITHGSPLSTTEINAWIASGAMSYSLPIMSGSGTGPTLAVLPHCWDGRTFAPTSATNQFDPERP
jgi:hypothetical protein